jgi:biotin carboxyl carrier protein
MKYTAIVNGKSVEIELSRTDQGSIAATIDGETIVATVQRVEDGLYWLEWNNRSFEISVMPDGDAYSVSLGGRRIAVEIVDSRNALRKAAQHGHDGMAELRAPMPGKVVKVLVTEGADVEVNQGLLVIEAMKMQNEVKSPKKGVVRKIGVKEAAAVNAGDLLVVVE